MKRRAVVAERDNRLVARVVRCEACASCRACAFGEKKEMDLALPEGKWQVGDEVEVELPEGGVSKASLLAYGLPLGGLILGLLVGMRLSGEAAGALGALLGTAAGFGLLRLLDGRIRRDVRFAPAVQATKKTDDKSERRT